MEDYISFGPVPSRRLGRSLGVNNIPGKTCTYGCVYCQIGKTIRMEFERREFYKIDEIINSVNRKIDSVEKRGEKIDFITFVPDGEPTLDLNLGKEIELLKATGIRVAVITNSSLIWRNDVRNDLQCADLVSLKVDAVHIDHWKKINRPHRLLELEKIKEGIFEFSSSFKGKLITETMVIGNFQYDFDGIASFLKSLKNLHKAYISIPTRPPAEEWVMKPEEVVINRAYQIYLNHLGEERVEYLIGYEGDEFSLSGDPEKDLLSIMSVHPMRIDAVIKFLEKSGANYSLIEKLINEGKIKEIVYYGNRFFMRRIL
ncbi:MAG: radical SAM protein [Thermoplasmata archaeon]